MFTIKFYSENGARQRIESADSFTILRRDKMACHTPLTPDDLGAEITLHRKNGDDIRVDVCPGEPVEGFPPRYAKAIIENAAGRTTEIIALNTVPSAVPLVRQGGYTPPDYRSDNRHD